MRFLIVAIFLIIAFYALKAPQKGSNKAERSTSESKDPTNNSFESSFEGGLPSDYIPSENAHYSDLQKLKDDYDYRWTKLHRHFEEEKKELRTSAEYSPVKMEALIQKQDLAKEEFQKKFEIMKTDFLKRIEEEKSSRDKGLR